MLFKLPHVTLQLTKISAIQGKILLKVRTNITKKSCNKGQRKFLSWRNNFQNPIPNPDNPLCKMKAHLRVLKKLKLTALLEREAKQLNISKEKNVLKSTISQDLKHSSKDKS